MTNMKQILYTISLLVLLGACTDETYTDALSADGGKPGKPVSVNLSLNVQPLQSPLDAGTKSGSQVVSSTEVCKGMEISLVKTPVTPETRAADMNEIKNFWVFQFNGTEPTSTLTQKHFYTGNSVKDVTLKTSAVKNRIIIIGNADQATFSSLQDNDTYPLEDFNKLGISYGTTSFPQHFPLFNPSDGSSSRTILTGSADIIVGENSQADIMLYRSTARVTVNLTLGEKMQKKGFSDWSYQFMNIPKTSFYHSIGRVPAFPGDAVGYAGYASATTSFPAPSYATTITANLPINLHHEVPFTTPEKRVTNAPLNSTYLQIMGIEPTASGTISKSVVYQIHLGSNFEGDYRVSPNYQYTHDNTKTDENDDDSRVIKFIPGYFGGALKMYDKNGVEVYNPNKGAVTWRYEKRIEVYISDVGGDGMWLAAGSASMPAANSFMDGRKNTADLIADKDKYLAIKKCIDLNASPVTSANLVWYTPSFGQSLGIYVSGAQTLKTLPNTTYWTSSIGGNFPWGTNIRTGLSNGQAPSTKYYLRCIKDLTPGDMMQ